MKKYINSFFILAIILSIPLSIFLLTALINLNIKQILFNLITLLIIWSIYFKLKTQNKLIFWISFIPVTIFWSILLIQEIRRILFIIENHGMDSANIPGSPLAFLIGFIFELIYFIPLTFALFNGIKYLKSSKNLKDN